MIVFLNGKFVDTKEAQVSVFDHGFLYGDGCFETLRTYQGELFRPQAHITRLKKSAQVLQIDFPWDEIQIEKWMNEVLAKNNFSKSRLRITITRGQNEFDFIGAKNPTILIVATELKPHPENLYQQGIKIETLQIERVLPQIKSMNLLPSILGQQIKKEKNVFETVFINQAGYITEGTISNFFIVSKNTIYTPPAKKVLVGITRDVVFELAQKLQIPIQEKNFTLKEANEADEAFLTSTVMDIMPVVEISGQIIKDGKVGNRTKQLIAAFREQIINVR